VKHAPPAQARPPSGNPAAGTESFHGVNDPVLEIHGLEVRFPGRQVPLTVINSLDLAIAKGEILGLVGESGCGKTMLARSILRLIPPQGRATGGRIAFDGVDLLALHHEDMRLIRGDKIAIVLQEPMTSLNPALRIGDQISEVLKAHRPQIGRAERMKLALDLLEQVGIQMAPQRLNQYPHELSGGIRQRVVIAMALVCGDVRLLIADEPTTALDVTIQAQILDLFTRLQAERRMAILLITHDLSVIAQTAHRVAVMYAGRIVEIAEVNHLFETPRHPYTRGLLLSLPRRGTGTPKSHLPAIAGSVPTLSNLAKGCRFFDRCPHAVQDRCRSSEPALEEAGPGNWVRCHRWRELPELLVPAAAKS
jgi:peptide/nickel transport system ATP-binding protein